MKDVFHKIASFFMALFVVFSTMSFTMNMHYCGDTLVDTEIFNKAQSCGMDMNIEGTESHHSNMKGKCCSEKHIIVKGQDDLNTSYDNFTIYQQHFIASFTYAYLNLFTSLEKKAIVYVAYRPPLVIKQIYKIDEIYLI